MAISASDPITPAMSRVGRMLFKPFSARKWFVMGFAAWLSTLGEGGGGNIQIPGGGGGGGGGPAPAPGGQPGGVVWTETSESEVFQEAKAFVLHHAWWIIPSVVAALALIVVLMWVRARAKFIFLESVAYDRAAIVEPWKRLRPLGNSYFRFSLLLAVLTMAAAVLVILATALLGLPDIRAEQLTGAGIAAIVIGVLSILAIAIVYGVIHAATEDFVLPLMYLRGSSVGPAWREFRQSIVPGNVGALVVFYILRIVFGLGSAFLILVGTCLTCCLASLPYISGVVFLPIWVFNRAYSLYFLRQFGPQYDLLVELYAEPISAFPVVMPAPHEQNMTTPRPPASNEGGGPGFTP